jgi:hypothetical protein
LHVAQTAPGAVHVFGGGGAAHDAGVFELDDYEVRLGQRLPLSAKARPAFDVHRDE